MTNTLIGICSCAQVAGSRDAADELVRAGHRGAHRRRQAEAHRAESARVDPAARLGEVVVLRCPHLMLADVAGDDRLAAGRLVQRLDHVPVSYTHLTLP